MSSNELVSAITERCQYYRKTYIIIDALDECQEDLRWELIDVLRAIESNLRIMVTSRFLDSIAEELGDAERLEIKANKADLELYIDRHILKNRNLRKVVEKSPSMRQDVKSAVIATVEDMCVKVFADASRISMIDKRAGFYLRVYMWSP